MINVTKTYLPDIEKYKSYVNKIFQSGWVTNNGTLVQELQRKLAEYLKVKNVVLVSNGTMALQVAYKLLNLKGSCITSPFSFVATVSSQIWEGLTPIFSDINEETLNIDSNKIEANITDRVTGIVPVHVFGNGCNVEEIDRIAQKYGLKVIYDAAHAFGVRYKGRSILSYGDISILSFHATKVFHTIEGGALIINNDELYEKAKLMINFGISGPDRIECIGINCKMNEFEAAMGICLLDDMDDILLKREKVYKYYEDNLSGMESIQLQKHNQNCTKNYGYFPVIFEDETTLLRVKKYLNEMNIYPRRYFYPSLDTLPYIGNDGYSPISNNISRRILCLPMYDSLEAKDQEIIISAIRKNI